MVNTGYQKLCKDKKGFRRKDWNFKPYPYLIFVIFFTQSNFLENKIYTEKRQFFALNQ